jgi:hypothetical protein
MRDGGHLRLIHEPTLGLCFERVNLNFRTLQPATSPARVSSIRQAVAVFQPTLKRNGLSDAESLPAPGSLQYRHLRNGSWLDQRIRGSGDEYSARLGNDFQSPVLSPLRKRKGRAAGGRTHQPDAGRRVGGRLPATQRHHGCHPRPRSARPMKIEAADVRRF